ncbi:MAG: transcriptional repressor [Fimbriimonadaceae bacterium]|jgi:Fe2+ or Zn2+ uptake regulation protein|nr:transcriptional repressor [Fimbriimonadaceae bacterium]
MSKNVGNGAGGRTSFEDVALTKLKAAGLRVTMPRVQVIRTLAEAQTPLSAYKVHEAVMGSGGRIDVVSVYRILRTLKEIGLIHHIVSADGYLACSASEPHTLETEHLICTECGRVDEILLDEDVKQKILAQGTSAGFEVESIRVEVIGVCPSCQ